MTRLVGGILAALVVHVLLSWVKCCDAADHATKTHNFLRADPDTTWSDKYRKNPSKDFCLDTKDHFLRPCEYCTDKKGNAFCYNADEARWAKFFGCNCEVKSEDSKRNDVVVEE